MTQQRVRSARRGQHVQGPADVLVAVGVDVAGQVGHEHVDDDQADIVPGDDARCGQVAGNGDRPGQ